MPLFKRKKEDQPMRHELCDIPIGSMIDLSDTTTFAIAEATTRTLQVVEYKRYEAEDFLRYMYRLVDDNEEVILGVNMILGTDECDLARFVIDSEEEFEEPLADTIVLEYDDPEQEGVTVPVEYTRNEIVYTRMTVVTAEGEEEYEAELHEYSADDGTFMSVELCESWLTFYVGEEISREDVSVFPIEEEGR